MDITNLGVPAQYQTKPSWFNWTKIKVFIPAGGSINIPLQISLPADIQPPANSLNGYIFTATATSTTNLAIAAKDSGIIRMQPPP